MRRLRNGNRTHILGADDFVAGPRSLHKPNIAWGLGAKRVADLYSFGSAWMGDIWSGCAPLMGSNLLAILVFTNSVTLTNWINTTAWRHDEDGTNYQKQRLYSITQTVERQEVVPILTYRTNTTVLKLSREVVQATNAPVQWVPVGGPGQPPLPGFVGKQ